MEHQRFMHVTMHVTDNTLSRCASDPLAYMSSNIYRVRPVILNAYYERTFSMFRGINRKDHAAVKDTNTGMYACTYFKL